MIVKVDGLAKSPVIFCGAQNNVSLSSFYLVILWLRFGFSTFYEMVKIVRRTRWHWIRPPDFIKIAPQFATGANNTGLWF